MALRKYRLTDDTEWIDRYAEKIGFQGIYDYKDKVDKALDSLKKGRYYNIAKDVPDDMQELFVKLCCMHIRDIDHDIIMSDDYSLVERTKM